MTDFVLLSTPASPFGRKVKIAAAVLSLSDRIAVEMTDTSAPDSRLRRENPLGKIPVLIDAAGMPIYDSRVIVEYLDLLAGGGRILPTEPQTRIAALRLQALADGVMDAALLRRYESLRQPAERSADWDANQAGKVERGLAALEAAPPTPGPITIGEIAVACALGYLDFRFDGTWRAAHPALVAWLAAFEAAVPSFGATTPSG
ncbi:MAG TPA: glutathione S-transferase family protein [Methylomirabilota bacterium]|nr:glutathione S-transferase family protein [Methylomirabilota bacterium]